MIIQLLEDETVAVEDPWNFGKFHVEINHTALSLEAIRRAFGHLAKVEDKETCWVSIPSLENLIAVENKADWQKQFLAMIEKARPHGWVNEKGTHIKAHIVWPNAQPE